MIHCRNRLRIFCASLAATFAIPTAGSFADTAHSHESCSAMAEHEHDAHLGNYSLPITTGDARVQKLFDEGINWTYGFNHAEAETKFREAAALDPDCAMCYWGIALVQGPNINAPMSSAAVPKAYQALQRALTKMQFASPKEQALIRALAQRYTSKVLKDRSPLDRAYAVAMSKVAKEFPDDLDLSVLAVEAKMDTMPWNYWTEEGKPREGTEEMIATLRRVLKKEPRHPGANHFLIHIVEKVRPELAEKAADTLVNLLPSAGHMQHMASHIYLRVGRYHDAVRVNQMAIKADKEFLKMCPTSSDFYRSLYVPHNYDFLIAAAILEGREKLARQTANELRAYIEPLLITSPEGLDLQNFWSAPLMTALRFQDWDAVLAQKEPRKEWTYARGLWHFGRAMALIGLGREEEGRKEIVQLRTIVKSPSMQKSMLMGLNSASSVLNIGLQEARAALAMSRDKPETAVGYLKLAVNLQDHLTYIEPPAWYRSLRLPLGHVYQEMGRYADAERAFKEDLKTYPKNGWALYGLYRNQKSQNLTDDSLVAFDAFNAAWKYADADLEKIEF